LASTAYYGYSVNSLHIDEVRTSQETHLLTSRACYRVRFTILYVDYVPTSQETHLRVSTACYGGQIYFFIGIRCSYFTGNTYGNPCIVTGIALLTLHERLFVTEQPNNECYSKVCEIIVASSVTVFT
jgi:hypothetical protein